MFSKCELDLDGVLASLESGSPGTTIKNDILGSKPISEYRQ